MGILNYGICGQKDLINLYIIKETIVHRIIKLVLKPPPGVLLRGLNTPSPEAHMLAGTNK